MARSNSRAMSPFAARAATDEELSQSDGITIFQHFRVGQAGVGHVGVNRVGSVEIRSGSRATADRLVIPEGFLSSTSEDEVVHGSLTGRHDTQGAENRIDNPLRRFHVATDNRGTPRGIIVWGWV